MPSHFIIQAAHVGKQQRGLGSGCWPFPKPQQVGTPDFFGNAVGYLTDCCCLSGGNVDGALYFRRQQGNKSGRDIGYMHEIADLVATGAWRRSSLEQGVDDGCHQPRRMLVCPIKKKYPAPCTA